MAKIHFKPNSTDGSFRINSEDTTGHPWGDFVLCYSRPLELIIDGRVIYFTPKKTFIMFHRDLEGIIDHFYEGDHPGNICPFCGRPGYEDRGPIK